MADIFISYSSKDRQQAEQLTELLSSAGLSCWIDKRGISGAMNWSAEIVEAINEVSTLLFLISPRSVASENCAKEIHLASEKKKNILPVILEPAQLPVIFEYPLAGLHHLHFEDFEGIKMAVDLLKTGKSALAAMELLSPSFIESSSELRLAVLPFDDLSPTQANNWFADGMMDELITTLDSLDQLKVCPRTDVIYYKGKRPKLGEIVNDLKVRYVVEGSVQKIGEKIRINVTLTDAHKKERMWSERYHGTFDDVFDLQDKTCFAITQALKLSLTEAEAKKIESRPTENPEAYELYLIGNQYYVRQTKADYEHALGLYEEAVRLDPKFATAFVTLAHVCLNIFHSYDPRSEWLERAEAAVAKALEVDGETALCAAVMSKICLYQGQANDALRFAKRSVELDPVSTPGYEALDFIYRTLGMPEEAVQAREEHVRLRENDPHSHFKLLTVLNEVGLQPERSERLRLAAERAIPVYHRHLRLNPDDHNARVQFANILYYANRKAESLEVANELSSVELLDGFALYNLACLYLDLQVPESGIVMLRHSVAKGLRQIESFRHDPDLNPLRGMPEFEEMMKELEEKIAGESQKSLESQKSKIKSQNLG